MSKFFTDYRNDTAFSLNHVMQVKKSCTFAPILDGKIYVFPNIEITLVTDGIITDARILFNEGLEDKRDLEFVRLMKALEDNSQTDH